MQVLRVSDGSVVWSRSFLSLTKQRIDVSADGQFIAIGNVNDIEVLKLENGSSVCTIQVGDDEY